MGVSPTLRCQRFGPHRYVSRRFQRTTASMTGGKHESGLNGAKRFVLVPMWGIATHSSAAECLPPTVSREGSGRDHSGWVDSTEYRNSKQECIQRKYD